jgi:GNAT superfamily N-acetyltransferase
MKKLSIRGGENGKIKIVPMAEKHLGQVFTLLIEVFNVFDEKAAIDELTLYIKAMKKNVEYGHDYWVSKDGNKVTGIIGLEYVGEDSAWLSWFAVGKKYRGMGIGRKLLEFVIEHAEKSGLKNISIECGTLPMFEKANKIYDRFGFQNKFTVSDFWSKNDDLLVKSKKIMHHTHH